MQRESGGNQVLLQLPEVLRPAVARVPEVIVQDSPAGVLHAQQGASVGVDYAKAELGAGPVTVCLRKAPSNVLRRRPFYNLGVPIIVGFKVEVIFSASSSLGAAGISPPSI